MLFIDSESGKVKSELAETPNQSLLEQELESTLNNWDRSWKGKELNCACLKSKYENALNGTDNFYCTL